MGQAQSTPSPKYQDAGKPPLACRPEVADTIAFIWLAGELFMSPS